MKNLSFACVGILVVTALSLLPLRGGGRAATPNPKPTAIQPAAALNSSLQRGTLEEPTLSLESQPLPQPAPEAEPAMIALGFPQPVPAAAPQGRRYPNIYAALRALQAARNHLQNAVHHYGGHRAKALDRTNDAINQLQQALEWARRH